VAGPIANGIHHLTRAEYDAIDRMNFSRLKLLEKSPAHFKWALDHPNTGDTEARMRGRAVALALFEPDVFEQVAVWRGKSRRGDAWEYFVRRHPGDEHLTAEIYDLARAIAKAVRSNPQASNLLKPGTRGEVSILWTHTAPAIPGWGEPYRFECKGRVDYLDQLAIVDLKNAIDVSPDGFGRAVATYSWHVQAAFYSDGVEAVTGRALPYFLLAVEPDPPFVAQVYAVPQWVIDLGRDTYRTWLDRLNICRQTDEWPGYASSQLQLELPRWLTPDLIDG
jgi:exodeoxyribonuclease VIII